MEFLNEFFHNQQIIFIGEDLAKLVLWGFIYFYSITIGSKHFILFFYSKVFYDLIFKLSLLNLYTF